MVLRYTNYDDLNIDDELEKIKKCEGAEVILQPKNKSCLFILGMLFAYGVHIKILNENELDFTESNKSFSLMSYVWSKIGDSQFEGLKEREIDKRIENAKNEGITLNPIVNNPIKNKIFLICPVRHATLEQRQWIEDFVKEKNRDGYIIHAPHLHTNQVDSLGGYSICIQNAQAVASSSEIDIFYDPKSEGSAFDLGVAYALHKPLKLLNKNEIVLDDSNFIDNLISNWPYKGISECNKIKNNYKFGEMILALRDEYMKCKHILDELNELVIVNGDTCNRYFTGLLSDYKNNIRINDKKILFYVEKRYNDLLKRIYHLKYSWYIMYLYSAYFNAEKDKNGLYRLSYDDQITLVDGKKYIPDVEVSDQVKFSYLIDELYNSDLMQLKRGKFAYNYDSISLNFDRVYINSALSDSTLTWNGINDSFEYSAKRIGTNKLIQDILSLEIPRDNISPDWINLLEKHENDFGKHLYLNIDNDIKSKSGILKLDDVEKDDSWVIFKVLKKK